MIQSYDRYITYICPACGRVATAPFSPFIFSGRKSLAVLCPECRTPCFTMHDMGKWYKTDIQCSLCQYSHSDRFRKPDLWKKPLLTTKCETTDIDCWFVGDEDEVNSAFEKAREDVEVLHPEINEDEFFEDYMPADGNEDLGELIAAICEYLHILLYEDSLLCRCGSSKINITVIDDTICVHCNSCGSTKQIKPTDDFLDELYQAESFIFNKK